MDETRDPYHILDVPKSALLESIKAAYRRLSKLYHPDADGGDAVKMADLNWAWNILGDAERRQAYDETGDTEFHKFTDALEKAAYDLLAQIGTSMFTDPNLSDEVFLMADLKATIRMRLDAQLDASVKLAASFQAGISRATLRKARITREPAYAIFSGATDHFIRVQGLGLQKEQDRQLALHKAIELLADFEFTPPATPYQVMPTVMQFPAGFRIGG